MRINPFYLHGEELTPVRKLLALKALAGGAPLSDYTVTGNPVSFETNVAKPLSVLAAFTPVQSGSGDPSPDNVRPITGWTGANVWRTGKNLLNPELKQFADTYELQKWGMEKTGNKANGDLVLQPGKYTISIGGKPGTEWAVRDTDGNVIVRIYSGTYMTFTLTKAQAVGIYISVNDAVEGAKFALQNYAMIEESETATTFEEYTGQSVSVTFPAEAGTVYGGTLDLSTGVLTVGWQFVTVTESDSLYGGATYNGESGTDRYKAIESTGLGATSMIGCGDQMKLFRGEVWGKPDEHIWEYCINNRQLHMVFDNETVEITSEMTESERTAAIKTWLENNPLHFVAPLATPLVYQLTPTEILSLIGNNVLWSDLNGDLTVTYKKKG